jgi:hypothetical protein
VPSLAKVGVGGSNPLARSNLSKKIKSLRHKPRGRALFNPPRGSRGEAAGEDPRCSFAAEAAARPPVDLVRALAGLEQF